MKEIIYKIAYFPPVNFVIINLIKVINKLASKNLSIPPSGSHKYQISNNQTIIIDSNQTSYLTKVIYWKGLNSFEYTSLFLDFIKQFEGFIDIGANIGYYSILAAKSNNKIQIYAFEPAFGPFHYLDKNIKLNKLNNRVNYFQLALSDKSGVVDFYEFYNPKYKKVKYNLGGTSSLNTDSQNKLLTKTTIEALTLDEFVSKNEIKVVDLIKIDTEGSEDLILSHATETLSKFRPIVICETLFDKIEPQLENLFSQLDYKFYNHSENELTPVDTIIRKVDNGIRDCFFVPKEKIHLISKYVNK
ncbi:MAG TPA: FkbM family methyltransferase [Bacteroidales bacterium]